MKTLVKVCPRAGVLNAPAYNAISGKSMVEIGIDPNDDVYVLSLADIVDGDLVAIKTPGGVLLRFIHWFEEEGDTKVRLESANPEIPTEIYDYDDEAVRTRWRAVWICRHGDHSKCESYKRPERKCSN